MKVAIIGHGGHGRVVQDLLSEYPEYRFIGFLDDRYSRVEEQEDFICAPIHYARSLMNHFCDIYFINAIGDNQLRKSIFKQLDLPNDYYLTLIHPKAVVSASAVIGKGTVIMPHAVVNAGATIQNHVIINTGAIVEHDSRIESYSHLSPNSTLTGGVKLEEGVHVGSGATILPGLTIGGWSKVGAGATVLQDISSYSTAVGVPAKVIGHLNKEKGVS